MHAAMLSKVMLGTCAENCLRTTMMICQRFVFWDYLERERHTNLHFGGSVTSSRWARQFTKCVSVGLCLLMGQNGNTNDIW
jgi:hypothetical protein